MRDDKRHHGEWFSSFYFLFSEGLERVLEMALHLTLGIICLAVSDSVLGRVTVRGSAALIRFIVKRKVRPPMTGCKTPCSHVEYVEQQLSGILALGPPEHDELRLVSYQE